jgi:hypothetical protein
VVEAKYAKAAYRPWGVWYYRRCCCRRSSGGHQITSRAALGLEPDEPDVREYLRSRGTTVSEPIISLIRDLDVAGCLAAAKVCGADIGALRRRLL